MAPTFDHIDSGNGHIEIIVNPENSRQEVLEAIIKASVTTAKLVTKTDSRDHKGITQRDFSGYVHLDNPLGNVVSIKDIDGLALNTYFYSREGRIYFDSDLYERDTGELFEKANKILSEE